MSKRKARNPTREVLQVPVLFVDLDGTVRKGYDELGRFVNGPEDVEVFEEAKVLIANWKKGGGRVVAVTNQAGVALGYLTTMDMWRALKETDKQTGEQFDRIMVCTHAPKDNCTCRKPGTWMVEKAQLEMASMFPGEIYPEHLALFVGDRPEDAECAKACGIPFMDAKEWRDQIDALAR